MAIVVKSVRLVPRVGFFGGVDFVRDSWTEVPEILASGGVTPTSPDLSRC